MKNKLKALWLFAKITAKNDPLYILVIILNALAPAAATMVNIFVPMIFINQITNPRPADQFIKILVLLIVGKILLESLERLLNREEFVRRQGINDYLTFELAKKAMDLTYQNIENPHTLDLKEKANAAINMGAIHNLLSCLKDIITSVATMIGTALVIISFSPYLVGFSILISFLIILVNGKQSAYTSKFDLEIVNVNRRFSYYFSLMASPHYQKEIRVFDLGEMLQSKTQGYLDQMMDGFEDKFGFEANMGAIKIFLESILRLVSYTYVAMRTLSAAYGPQISFGSFSAIIGANENFMTSFQTMFSELADFIMSLANLEPLYDFYILDSDFEENLEKASDFQSLEFKNVTFTYPGSERKIIDNLSFRINKGEKISIVGVNNAGKTTIVKLLLRFFDIDSGEILYNGVNIKNIRKKSLYEKISGVFQDFSIMPFTIKENIIGNKAFSENKTDEIIKQLDLDQKIKELPRGINTYLNKDIYENATDLSLGQKQKLAIARALYQDADFLILDEPTASLDPLAESKIYEHFNEMTEGKTAIFISHRMSSSRFTDKILLLDGGRAAAFDSHDKLMAYDNLYSKLYKAQAQYFE
ncbi:ABC transporter ATP-binding protein [Anaerococcus degeneri]|uniref:ABC transporter ATP-binding protein/permease n=1 Tax=Anaerococcus degeneri TaxID=361500 RepID=A0ABS7YY91_9FIRM|nr:ABC transporter ATP-binding protein [Anaerococcus degeneri]MBP2016300.1 ATP-binding cassette subfamily C protein [Anaerococcus degeneri]MCA2096696.1 ABC transporter ATP-binding protein/permease [Anaerococcus degeneri]